MFSPAADHHQLLHYHCPPPPLPSPLMEHMISSKPAVEVAPNCPRCASSSTKFCYFNNYSLSQPRYFCKACRRYWTKGGSLRNVPVGGGCRKTRRSKSIRSDRPASFSSSSQDSGDRSDTSNGDSADIDMAAVFAKFLNQKPDSGSESGSDSRSCYDPNQPAVSVGGGGGVLPDPDRYCYPEDQRIDDRQVAVENDDFGFDSLLGDHHDRHRHEAVELQDVFWSDHDETWKLQELEAFPTNLISDNWSPLDLYSGFEVFSRS